MQRQRPLAERTRPRGASEAVKAKPRQGETDRGINHETEATQEKKHCGCGL